LEQLLSALADSFRLYWTSEVQPNLAPNLTKLAIFGLILAIAYALADRMRRLSTRATRLTRADTNTSLLIGRIVYIGVIAGGVVVALGALGIQWTALIAVIGAVSLAISFAIQDVLKNFVAGLYLLIERPFFIGQEVKVKDHVGTVETVGIRTTVLRTDENVQVVIPNALIFNEVLVNRDAYGGPTAPAEIKAAEEGP
jgi:small conductance mechanosensitive channel